MKSTHRAQNTCLQIERFGIQIVLSKTALDIPNKGMIKVINRLDMRQRQSLISSAQDKISLSQRFVSSLMPPGYCNSFLRFMV